MPVWERGLEFLLRESVLTALTVLRRLVDFIAGLKHLGWYHLVSVLLS